MDAPSFMDASEQENLKKVCSIVQTGFLSPDILVSHLCVLEGLTSPGVRRPACGLDP
jgi:hypothetical protein